MRKILSLCLCLMLLALSAVPVLAAADVVMTLKTDQQTLKPGDQVTIFLDVQAERSCSSFGMMMVYDEKVFEVLEGSCKVSGALLASFDPTRGFVAAYALGGDPKGEVGKVTLRVRSDAPVGEATFTGNTSVKDGSTSLECSINTLTFQITGDTTQETQYQQNQETQSHSTEQTQQTTTTQMQEQTQTMESSETNTNPTGTSQSGEQTTQSFQQKKDATLLVAVIAVAVVAAMAVGGYLVLKKKHK